MSVLADLLARQGREVKDLADDEVRAAYKLYRRTRGELIQRLEELDDGTFTAQQYRVALVQTEDGLRHLEREMNKRLDESVPRTARLASKHLRQQVEAFGKEFRGSIRPFASKQALVIEMGRSLLLPQFEQSVERYGLELIKGMQQRLALGMLSNESVDNIRRRLFKEFLQPLQTVELAGAQVPVTAYWAERIVRTELQQAYSTVTQFELQQAAEEEPKLQKRWSATMEKRTCPLCRRLDGQVRPINGYFRLPGGRLISGPTAHPNCMCVIQAWMPAWNPAAKELQ